MAAEVFAAVTSLRSALDVTKAMIGLRDAEAFRSKSIELQNLILEALEKGIEAREAYAAQLDRVRALEAEVANLKEWDTEKSHYELKIVGIAGSLAYMLNRHMRGTGPPHWLCPDCFAQRKKAFFQGQRTRGPYRVHVCAGCKSEILASGPPKWLD
jgi:hypothetical protein